MKRGTYCEECGERKNLIKRETTAHVWVVGQDDGGHEEIVERTLCPECSKLCGYKDE